MPLTEKGYQRPTYNELLEAQEIRAKTLFGNTINTNENTTLGKFIRLNVSDFDQLYQDAEKIYYARFPNSATGQSLDRLCVFAGISRNPATPAKHLVRIFGQDGAVVPMGFLLSTTEQDVVFYTGENVVLTGGESNVTVICDAPGEDGNVYVGAIDTVVNPSAAVDSIKHIALIEAGESIESDYELRKRFSGALSGMGSSSIDTIRGAILRVSQVGGATVIENDSDYEKDGQPPHSFTCYVLAPDESNQLIAEAIFSKKPIGIQSVGELAFTVKDEAKQNHTVYFTKTNRKDIYIKAVVLVDNLFLQSGTDEIRQALTEKLEALANGETVYISSLYKPMFVEGVVNVSALSLSDDGINYRAADITCTFREVARTDTAKIEIEVLTVEE